MSRRSLVLLAALAACTRPPAEPPAAPASPATFVGSDMCTGCHDEQATSMAKTIHGHAIFDEQRPEAERGCEACHGAGSIHVEEGGTEKGGMHQFEEDESARSRSQPCLACHGGMGRLHDFLSGGHAMAQVACSDCHRVHTPKTPHLLAAKPPELCETCHQDVRATFALTEHHKVPEGVVGCLDCHEPHGSRQRALLKDDEDRLCTTCHTEVQGPFVFEHAG
jgi:DmsE family decaheme c-type cytochrome